MRSEALIRQNMSRPLKGTEPDLVGYWDFSEGHGDILHDRTPYKNHARIKGAQWVSLDGKAVAKQPTANDPEAPKAGEWKSLFDGKTLKGWRVVQEGPFARHGKIEVEQGRLAIDPQGLHTGVSWEGDFPREDYEVAFDAMRVGGNHCFCVAFLPVGTAQCGLIMAGSGGTVVGIGLVDGKPSRENATTTRATFENGRWYGVRLRVTQARITLWLDEKEVFSLERRLPQNSRAQAADA